MTMPWLSNCEHSGDGWCINCVRKEHDEYEQKIEDLQKEIKHLRDALFEALPSGD